PEKLTVKIFLNSESAIAGIQGEWNRQTNKWWTKQKNSSIIARIIELMSIKNLENLQRKISPDKLTSWLFGETQGQKEAIREEIIRNLTRKKIEQTLYEVCIEKKAKQKPRSRPIAVRSKEIYKKRDKALECKRLE
ncbi:8252_t:CDS:2, partial [Gigaspora margarita]